jgi:hypothetical protein
LIRNPIYTLYGLLLLSGFSFMTWRGSSLGGITELKNVPKSVRENPGVYRSHYSWLPYMFRGK